MYFDIVYFDYLIVHVQVLRLLIIFLNLIPNSRMDVNFLLLAEFLILLVVTYIFVWIIAIITH